MRIFKMTESTYYALDSDLCGLCVSCGSEQLGCEPDARRYPCEACGKRTVYGAQELLLMGRIDLIDDEPSEPRETRQRPGHTIYRDVRAADLERDYQRAVRFNCGATVRDRDGCHDVCQECLDEMAARGKITPATVRWIDPSTSAPIKPAQCECCRMEY